VEENLVQVLRARVAEHPDKALLRYYRDGAWRDMSYGEVYRRCEAIAGGLAALGVQIGDRIGILSENRPEWTLADLGALCAGAVVVTVYPTLTADESAYILDHAGVRVVFAENAEQLAKIRAVRDKLRDVERIVLFEGHDPDAVALADLESLGPGAARLAEAAALPGETVFSILYTSGTTGVPKGVVLTHHNAIATLEAVMQATPDTTPYDLNCSFLPLAHALERMAGELVLLYMGRTMAFARGLQTLPDDLLAVRPSFLVVVPRVLEKICARFHARLAGEPAWKRRLARWSFGVGRQASMAWERGRPLGGWLRLRYALADRLVFAKIRARLGGNLKLLACGSAPLSVDVARFFHGAGITVCEGWGATETSAPVTINLPHDYRLGSVGKPIPGVEVRLADDGELLVRGPGVFREYYRDPETTRAAFTEDGFYRTGDIGRVDEDGYYYIVDRKKELIITSNGKNVAPQKLESLLRERMMISNALVHGDRRPCLVALITVDREAAAGLDPAAVRERVAGEIEAVNAKLPRFEQIKAFAILDGDFSHEGGELTLTLKLRRRVVEARYRDLLESLYDADLLAGA